MVTVEELDNIRSAANNYTEYGFLNSLDDRCKFEGGEYTVR